MATDSAHRASLAATTSLVVTSFVVAAKLYAAYRTGSVSVLAEALQSLADVAIASGVLAAVRIAAKPPDDDHPYGHGKAELLMSALQMVLLIGVSGFIISKAIDRFSKPQGVEAEIGLYVMGGAAVVNLIMATWIARVAKETNSHALEGEVMHLRSDAIAAAGVMVGLLAVQLTGLIWLDPLVAIGFTLVVVVGAVKTLQKLTHPLMDGALSPDELARVTALLHADPRVRDFHQLRTRTSGSVRHVDLHVLMDDDLSFVDAHELAEEIEEQIRQALGGAWVNVHYEPYEAEKRHRREKHGD